MYNSSYILYPPNVDTVGYVRTLTQSSVKLLIGHIYVKIYIVRSWCTSRYNHFVNFWENRKILMAFEDKLKCTLEWGAFKYYVII